MNKNIEKKSRRTIKAAPTHNVPMVDAMDAWYANNRSSNSFIEHKGMRRFWQVTILVFMGCLGYWAYDIHKQYALFNQQALCNAVVLKDQQQMNLGQQSQTMEALPALNEPIRTVADTPVAKQNDLISKINIAPLTGFVDEDKNITLASEPEVHPSLKLINKPRDPSIIANLSQDSVRDAFDSAEENFIETQSGQEFSKKDTALFPSNTPTITQDKAPFKMAPNPQDIQQWLLRQHIKGVAYKDFESCFILNSKIFHLNEVVYPEYNLVWSDIDPVDKKLFFSDDAGHLYTLNY